MTTELECLDYSEAKELAIVINRNCKAVHAYVRSARADHWAVVIRPSKGE